MRGTPQHQKEGQAHQEASGGHLVAPLYVGRDGASGEKIDQHLATKPTGALDAPSRFRGGIVPAGMSENHHHSIAQSDGGGCTDGRGDDSASTKGGPVHRQLRSRGAWWLPPGLAFSAGGVRSPRWVSASVPPCDITREPFFRDVIQSSPTPRAPKERTPTTQVAPHGRREASYRAGGDAFRARRLVADDRRLTQPLLRNHPINVLGFGVASRCPGCDEG